MSKYDVSTDGEAWNALRQQLKEMQATLDRPQFNLVQFAKLYEATAKTLLDAVKKEGMSSSRFEAAAKALDLSTPSSKLEQFLQN